MLLPFSSNISQRISFSGLNCLIVYAQCGNGHIPRAYVNSTSCLALHKMGVEHQRTSIYIRACSLQEQICEVQVSLTDMYHTTYFVVEVVPLWYDTHPLLVSTQQSIWTYRRNISPEFWYLPIHPNEKWTSHWRTQRVNLECEHTLYTRRLPYWRVMIILNPF